MLQPDLGTALLVASAGFFVLFLAGLSWKILAGLVVAGAASLPVLWGMMHDYQRQRVLTMLDPSQDPLGSGYHTIQSTIAMGSGGLFGKGWLNGTQARLDFLPERTTDFVFAVYSEEFGLFGNLILLILFVLLIGRGLYIAANASVLFSRLLAGAVTLTFFTYAFVNMGMVSGILPVVGVPLPLISYGGTSLVTLLFGLGILMIDLSYAAAVKLGIAGPGSGPVEVERVFAGDAPRLAAATPAAPAAPGPTPTPAPTTTVTPLRPDTVPAPQPIVETPLVAPATGGLVVQLGAFSSADNAESFRDRLARDLPWLLEPIQVAAGGGLHRVRLGPYRTRDEAQAIADKIRASLGIEPVISPVPSPTAR
jgi:cell division septation protein DedD